MRRLKIALMCALGGYALVLIQMPILNYACKYGHTTLGVVCGVLMLLWVVVGVIGCAVIVAHDDWCV